MSTVSPAYAELFGKLRFLHTRALAGDPEAARDCAALKEAGKTNRSAKLAFNTLAALHWQSQMPAWRGCERFYTGLLKNDREAVQKLQSVMAKRAKGDETSKKIFATLKAIHNQRKLSVWYPGAPQTGYYPMPRHHRPGIQFGADPAPQYPWDPSLLSQVPGLLNSVQNLGIPGLGGQPLGPLGGVPGLPGFSAPTLPFSPPDVGQYVQLSPQVVQAILNLIQVALRTPSPYGPGGAVIFRSGRPTDLPPELPPMSTVPPSTADTSTPLPAYASAITAPPPATIKTLGKRMTISPFQTLDQLRRGALY